MSKLWIFAYIEYTGDVSNSIVIRSSDKASVGRYVKENPEVFHELFEEMKYITYYKSEVRKALYPKDGPKYPNIDVKKALSEIPDDEIISEFQSYEKDCESSAVNVICIEESKIINIS
jgi:hypothetical protein